MKKIFTKKQLPKLSLSIVALAGGLVGVLFLMFYKLGSLTNGLSSGEVMVRTQSLGWRGIYINPLNLPLKVFRSLDFKYIHLTTNFWLRLPNALIGLVTIICFYILLRLWYSQRIAIAGGALFATSAWVLHVSRLASFNIDYLAGVTLFILSTAILHKYADKRYVHPWINLLWGLLLYIPGMVWLVAINGIRQRNQIFKGFKIQGSFSRIVLYFVSFLLPLPLIIKYLISSPKNVFYFLGLPSHWPKVSVFLKDLGGVFVHLLVRGPEYPNLWLGRQPMLDIFCLLCLALGVIFYASHLTATRSQLLFGSFIIGTLLIALNGGVDLSFLLPIVFLFVAAGIAYLLQQWLSVFPKNPIARATGYILVTLAIAISCLYGSRSYFVAWPHDPTTQSVFDKKLAD